MTIAMTDQQKDELNGQGFTVLERVLSESELQRLSVCMDEVADQLRKVRWVRPSGYVEQDPELIARSSPIRRQLLGAIGDGSNLLGKDPIGNPSSQHWFTADWDSVPLKAWAEERAGPGPYDWGLGLGATFTKGPDYQFTRVKVPQSRRTP